MLPAAAPLVPERRSVMVQVLANDLIETIEDHVIWVVALLFLCALS
jgi:hypothetical protein